jgi:hypothetical protein
MLLLAARYVFVSVVSILRRQPPTPFIAEAVEGVCAIVEFFLYSSAFLLMRLVFAASKLFPPQLLVRLLSGGWGGGSKT